MGLQTFRRGAAVVLTLAAIGACSGGDSEVASSQPPATQVDDSAASTSATEPSTTAAESSTEPTTEPISAPPTTTPRETTTQLVLDPDTGEVSEVEVDLDQPTTYAEVVDAGIDAGLWDEVEGLTRALEHAIGVLPSEQVPGVDEIITGELTDILVRAEDLIRDSTGDAAALAVLDQRTSLIMPSQETLDQIAEQPGAIRSGFARSAAPACAPVHPDDWDSQAWVEGCYQVVERDLTDATLRVFYPAWYDDDGNLSSLPIVTLGALEKSITTYRDLGRVGDIDVVFSATDTVENKSSLASAIASRTNGIADQCRISLFPVASADSIDEFEQTIAHEAWHCVQYYDGMIFADGDWFVEGGAEFFSNVVYPSVNDEHGWLRKFEVGVETPLHQMSYEAWIWWQYLSNEFSPSFVADLHREMYGSGGTAIGALEGYEVMLHDFVADFVAGVVVDQDGSGLGRARHFAVRPPVVETDEGREIVITYTSWAPYRWSVSYDKELRVLQTDASTRGTRSMAEWKSRADRAAWKGVFPEIRSTCTKPKVYGGVATDASTATSSDLIEFKLVIDLVEKAECDPCLLGTWSLDLDTFEELIKSASASGGGMPPGATFELEGAYFISLDEESVVLEQRDNLTIVASVAGAGTIRITINSFANGTYTADGESLEVSELVESFNEVSVDVPFGANTFSFPGAVDGAAGTYTCDENQLVVTTGTNPSITWVRVDKILTPPKAPTDPNTAAPNDD